MDQGDRDRGGNVRVKPCEIFASPFGKSRHAKKYLPIITEFQSLHQFECKGQRQKQQYQQIQDRLEDMNIGWREMHIALTAFSGNKLGLEQVQMVTHKDQTQDLQSHHGQVFNLTVALIFSVHPQVRLLDLVQFSYFSPCLFIFLVKPNFHKKKENYTRWEQSFSPSKPLPALCIFKHQQYHTRM